MIELIYGTDSEDAGNKWVYNLRVVNSIANMNLLNNNPNSPMNWMLGIDRISEKETIKLASRYGLTVSNGLEMVR